MSNNTQGNVNPFVSFKIVVTLLTIAGFYKIQSARKYIRVSHYIYRIFVLIFACIYNVTHLIYIYTSSHYDKSSLIYGLVIAIPQLNLITKVGTMFIKASRIQRVHQLIKDPIFSATNNKDEEIIRKNNTDMIKLSKFAIYNITGGGIMWMLSFVFKRLEDPENAKVPAYMPFDTTSTLGYTLSVLCEVGPILWIGFGHFGADCVVGTYYSQATTQIKILKYNLEHMFDQDDENKENIGTVELGNGTEQGFQYIDEVNENIRLKFIYFVERYKKITWYVDEINAIFNTSMSCQFFSTSVTSCLVIYDLSMTDIFSVNFVHMFILLLIYKSQVLLYCYYGHQVEHESLTMNTAMYFSDWLSVSPRLRRDMLIAMARWGRPLTPRVSIIVPVSLITFASIVKTTYRLYTVMKSSHLA